MAERPARPDRMEGRLSIHDVLETGVRVEHPRYGLGRLVEVDGAEPPRCKGTVRFDADPEGKAHRVFVLSRSPLRAVPEAGPVFPRIAR